MAVDVQLKRDLQVELGPEYSTDLRGALASGRVCCLWPCDPNRRLFHGATAEWDLKDPSWRYDAIPEILDGRNVADFIDPDIMAKLAELEVHTTTRGQRL